MFCIFSKLVFVGSVAAPLVVCSAPAPLIHFTRNAATRVVVTPLPSTDPTVLEAISNAEKIKKFNKYGPQPIKTSGYYKLKLGHQYRENEPNFNRYRYLIPP
jgi:hypothetical protein